MALIFIEGFDHLSTSSTDQEWEKWDYHNLDYEASIVDPGRNSRGKALSFRFGRLGKYVPVRDEYIVGFAFKASAFPSDDYHEICVFQLGTDDHFQVILWDTGQLQGRRGEISDANGMLGSKGRLLSVDTWYYIECRVKIGSGTSGSFEIRVNGTTDCSASEVSTQGYGCTLTDITQICVCADGLSSYYYFDDLYICDITGYRNNNFLGDSRVDVCLPTGNGYHNDFLGSDSNSTDNYMLVDDAGASFTDNVASEAAGEIDTYTFGDMPYEPENINGVQVTVYARRKSAAFRSLASVTRINGIDYVHGRRGLSTSDRFYMHMNELMPSGDGLWSKAAVDAAEFGVKVVA